MAAYLNRRDLGSVALFCGFLLGTGSLGAQTLVDPTRPPIQMGEASPLTAPVAGAGLQLQSVLISSKRREAVINGETVQAGDTVGDARLLRILETEVVLRVGDEVRVLRMYPNVEKRFSVAGRSAGEGKEKQ